MVAGARRHVDCFAGDTQSRLYMEGGLDSFLDEVARSARSERVALLLSGDPCLFSLLGRIASRFHPGEYEVLPGLASFQLLFARLASLPGWDGPAQWDDLRLRSLHGRPVEAEAAMLHESRWTLFFLDSNNNGPSVARHLLESGAGDRRAVLAERLGYEDERILDATLGEIADHDSGEGLALLLAGPGPLPRTSIGVLPDSWFARGEGIPMSKEICRALVVSLLLPLDGLSLLEIGAGTGGLTVELARRAAGGRIVSLDRSRAALSVAGENLGRAGLSPLVDLVCGEAPEALAGLRGDSGAPARFHRAVVGGHGPRTEEVVAAAWGMLLPGGRLLAAANMPSSADRIYRELKELGGAPSLCHINSSSARDAGEGGSWMLSAANPVFIVHADREP